MGEARHERPSKEGRAGKSAEPDLLSNEGELNQVLRSLVSSDGLQVAWSKMAKRLRAAEQALEGCIRRVGEIPQEIERLEGKLSAQGESVAILVNFHDQLSPWVSPDKLRRIDDALVRIDNQEDDLKSVRSSLDALQARHDELEAFTQTLPTMETVDSCRTDAVADALAKRRPAEEVCAEATQQLREELAQLEERASKFAEERVGDAMGELGLSGSPTCDVRAPLRKGQTFLVDMVEQTLVKQLRDELKETCEDMEARHTDVQEQSKSLRQQLQTTDKSVKDANMAIRHATSDLRQEMSMKSSREDLQEAEGRLRISYTHLQESFEDLQRQVGDSLSRFRDHFQKVQNVMEDHDHIMRDHAEELENRATKYQLLLLREDTDGRVHKDDWNQEAKTMHQLSADLASRVAKLEAIKKVRSRQTSKPKATVSASRLQEASTAATVKESNAQEGAAGTSRQMENPTTNAAEGLTMAGDGGDENDDDDEDVDEHNDRDFAEDSSAHAALTTMRQQLESVAMGLVGLGHLLLCDRKVSPSMTSRLLHEKDLLDELHNVRHWVSNNAPPAGWDTSKLTTVALASAHEPRAQVSVPPLRRRIAQTAQAVDDLGGPSSASEVLPNDLLGNGEDQVEAWRKHVVAKARQGIIPADSIGTAKGAKSAPFPSPRRPLSMPPQLAAVKAPAAKLGSMAPVPPSGKLPLSARQAKSPKADLPPLRGTVLELGG